MFVKVANFENHKTITVRINDREPFPGDQNPKSGSRIVNSSLVPPNASSSTGRARPGNRQVPSSPPLPHAELAWRASVVGQ